MGEMKVLKLSLGELSDIFQFYFQSIYNLTTLHYASLKLG